jgi:heme exporter protein B
VLSKDLRLDLRSRDRVGHMAMFALLIAALLSVTLPEHPDAARAWVPALIWVVLLLTSLLGLARSFESEREAGALAVLASVPCDRGWVFAGKAAANGLALVGTALWTGVLFTVFLGTDWSPGGGRALASAALGSWGLAAVGTLLAAIAASVRFRAFLLPVLLFPLVLPVLVIGSRLTADALDAVASPASWWGALVLYDWIFTLIGYFVFDYVLED